YGLIRRSRPRLRSVMPVTVPAMLTCMMLNGLGIGDQYTCSFFRRMLRMKLMPQVCTGTSGDLTVTTGMAISAVHPSLVRRAAASHTPFQSLLMFDADPRVLPPPSS